jgi:hypothetical protein
LRSGGSVVKRPPPTVAPMTIPALINTTFLAMCWPASVGANGKRVNVSAGDQDQRHGRAHHLHRQQEEGRPKKALRQAVRARSRTPKVARTGSDTAGPLVPTVRCSIVRAARSSAGLMPDTNFSAPNQKKMNPRPLQ